MSVSAPRDLSWCRAAFRDLDAPIPGRPRPGVVWPSQRRSWDTGPIGPGPASSMLGRRPHTPTLVEQAITHSGVLPRRVDAVGATLLAWDEIVRVGTAHLLEDPAAARALVTVRERWDLEESMLWHFFGHHGTLGVAAHRAVVAELYDAGSLLVTVTAAITSGRLLRF